MNRKRLLMAGTVVRPTLLGKTIDALFQRLTGWVWRSGSGAGCQPDLVLMRLAASVFIDHPVDRRTALGANGAIMSL